LGAVGEAAASVGIEEEDAEGFGAGAFECGEEGGEDPVPEFFLAFGIGGDGFVFEVVADEGIGSFATVELAARGLADAARPGAGVEAVQSVASLLPRRGEMDSP